MRLYDSLRVLQLPSSLQNNTGCSQFKFKNKKILSFHFSNSDLPALYTVVFVFVKLCLLHLSAYVGTSRRALSSFEENHVLLLHVAFYIIITGFLIYRLPVNSSKRFTIYSLKKKTIVLSLHRASQSVGWPPTSHQP